MLLIRAIEAARGNLQSARASSLHYILDCKLFSTAEKVVAWQDRTHCAQMWRVT
jgi:hypothetical protein